MSNTVVSARIVKLLDSNKAIAAFVAPTVVTLGGIAANWISSGEWDELETRGAIAGLVLAVVSSFSTWTAKAKSAVVEVDTDRRAV